MDQVDGTLGGFDRALGLLEFDQIRQRLAGYARTVLGQERALELTPVGDAREIGTRLQETDEARLFLDNGGGLEFGPGADLREYVQRAMLGGSLRGEELHQVQQLAAAAGFNRKALAHRDDLPLLAGMAANIPDLGGLEEAIRRAISPAGEILDDASTELRQLRRESRSAYQQLNEVMQRSLRRYQQRAVVQEPIITQRNGRLVLLIKAENKSQIPGIVHDVSDSGATVFIEPLPAIERATAGGRPAWPKSGRRSGCCGPWPRGWATRDMTCNWPWTCWLDWTWPWPRAATPPTAGPWPQLFMCQGRPSISSG